MALLEDEYKTMAILKLLKLKKYTFIIERYICINIITDLYNGMFFKTL